MKFYETVFNAASVMANSISICFDALAQFECSVRLSDGFVCTDASVSAGNLTNQLSSELPSPLPTLTDLNYLHQKSFRPGRRMMLSIIRSDPT